MTADDAATSPIMWNRSHDEVLFNVLLGAEGAAMASEPVPHVSATRAAMCPSALCRHDIGTFLAPMGVALWAAVRRG